MKRKLAHSLIALLLICVVLPTTNVSAQNASQKRVTLNLEAVPVKRLFDEIRKQTGLNFVYNTEQTNTLKPITIKVENTSVPDVLQKVFSNTGFSYNIDGNTITIRRSSSNIPTVAPASSSKPEKVTVLRGTVYDSKKEVLPGVTIWLMGTRVGTHTEADGTYTLEIPETSDPVLQYAMIGMNTQNIKYKGQTELSVTLSENETMLKEISVVSNGMFVRKAESFTGAVTTYNKEQLKSVGNQNVLAS